MNKDIQTLIEREAEQLDSAIQHCIDIQEKNCTNELCKNDHHQLQIWLEELRSLKSLFKWRKVSEELPPLGEEVIFYNPAWVDEDFNPKGTRIGFRLDEDYVSSYYWSDQDCYMTISHSECDDNPAYSEKTKSSIEPIEWMPIPNID